MATSADIKRRARALGKKTNSESIGPVEVGNLIYDGVEYAEEVERNGGTLGIRKVYASVALMEADGVAPVDFWGKRIKKGNLVVVYDGTDAGVDNNKVYAFMGPGWRLVTGLDAGYATNEKVAELEQLVNSSIIELSFDKNNLTVGNCNNSVVGIFLNYGVVLNYNYGIFDCYYGQYVYIDTLGGVNRSLSFAFCDSSKKVIQPCPLESNIKGAFKAPQGSRFISVNCLSEYLDTFTCKIGSYAYITATDLSDKVNENTSYVLLIKNALNIKSAKNDYSDYKITKEFLYNYGKGVLSNNNTDCTGFIPVAEGDEVYYEGLTGTGDDIYAVAGYTKEDLSTASVLIAGTKLVFKKETITIKKGINYIRASSRNKNHELTPANMVLEVTSADSSRLLEIEADIIELKGNVPGREGFAIDNYFSVSVNTKTPFKYTFSAIDDSSTNDNISEDFDYCVLMLPKGHSYNQKALKLVAVFHGSGEPVNESSSALTSFATVCYFIACGYAVLAVNGLPKKFSDDNSMEYGRTCGNWMAIESTNKAIEHVCKNFNIDITDIYVYGESQGGMTAMNFIECGGYKVKAAVLDSPAISMLYIQTKILGSKNLSILYGITSTNDYDQNKVAGLDPYARNCTEVVNAEVVQRNGLILSEEGVESITSLRYTSAPIKFFLGEQDSTCPPYINQIVAKQLKNSGQLCECLVYKGVGHCVDTHSKKIGKITVGSRAIAQISQPMIDMAVWFSRFGGYKTATVDPL